MRKPLYIPMMMFGRFRRRRAKRDDEGNTIILRRGKNNRPIYDMERYWLTHSKSDGDPGVYPSVNEIYVRMYRGRQRYSKPAEQLFETWQTEARMWMHEVGWETTDKEKVVIELTAYFPNDRRKRDTNNVFKMMLDAFSEIIYDDDEYALPRVVDFHKVEEGVEPYFEINVFLKSEEDEVLRKRLENINQE